MHVDQLLLAVFILLAVTALCVSVFSRLGMGSVIGFLAAGILVGPSGLALTTEVEAIRQLAELGVVLLLFLIGLEMQPKKLWSMRRLVFGLGTTQIVATGVVIAAYAGLFFSWQDAVILGLGLALSSTAYVLQMLGERSETTTAHGQASLAVLLMQDLAIVPILALVPLLSYGAPDASDTSLPLKVILVAGVLLAVFVAGRYLFPLLLSWAAQRRNMDAFALFAMIAVLGAAYLMELAGMSMALGAFMIGMLLSVSEYRHQIQAEVEPFKGLLLALFFISVGMSIDLGFLKLTGVAIAAHVAIIVFFKALTLLVLGMFFGLGRATSICTAFLLSQCGEFGFVLFGAGLASGLFDEFQFAVAILTITVSMMVTPLMTRLGAWLADRYAEDRDERVSLSVSAITLDPGLERHVVVAGYGRVGQIICRMLDANGIPFVAFDINARLVEKGREAGHAVHFGTMSDPRVLDAAGVARASALVVTLGAVQPTTRLIGLVRTTNPSTPIFARALSLEAQDLLMASGATQVIPTVAEGGLLLGRLTLEAAGISKETATELINTLRRDNYAYLRSQTKLPKETAEAEG